MGKCEESAEFLEYWKNNGSELGPDFLQTADCPPPEWIPLLTIGKSVQFSCVRVQFGQDSFNIRMR
jgi:hypothetical protein